ncbi:2,3-bisphosphoglycerate-independent phosphoglycerate mutase [Methanimicrococcus sp. At1]|uniref:2,3-bisphosphoglycerate-independent phosphoglycerate mutase n=1 Tax=Methanimicrococcus hacksteinii TaxID=3028293 RepID=A0ABU3VPL2_9EURY|nr:cofactor-independent phosphoglycerate mutase [Methanimicrococcus sp. At1]MDV0445250.1 2,3-bisphosphoglycerate-independent phosphoglycerate mutase [Methanimicrococcus sp. At1]
MKYIVIIGDGMADLPIPELGGKTILQAAEKPNLDYLAKNGRTGLAMTVPEGYPPGSDVANMSIFGYDPAVYYTGRSPLEALSMGVSLQGNDLAFRTNLITIGNADNTVGADGPRLEDAYVVDYSGGHITSEEAAELIQAVDEKFGNDRFKFYPGISYRHLLVAQDNYGKELLFTPPHDITGQKASDYFPKGNGDPASEDAAQTYLDMTAASYDVLKNHPVNQKRVSEGKLPANCIWLWGQGNAPKFELFEKLHHKTGAVISAVDLLKGIGICAGLDVIDVEGATGFLDTNYKGKADAAAEALKSKDFVFVHIEAPDECGHIGDYQKKMQAVVDLDSKIIGPLLEYAKSLDEPCRILVMPDHPTPVALKTHTSDPIPFVLYDTRETDADGVFVFDEESVKSGSFGTVYASELVSLMIQDD